MKELQIKPLLLPRSVTQNSYTNIDPLDGRYSNDQATMYLSEGARITYQAYVEYALVHTLAEFGVCSEAVADEVYESLNRATPEAVGEAERITKHDVKALIDVMRAAVSVESRQFIHMGATSTDIVSTAQSLQMRRASEQLLLPALSSLNATLISIVDTYADTVQIGRTHGQHAVPITFGFAISEYVSRIGESIQEIEKRAGALVGKFSGAVGAYNAMTLLVDEPLLFERRLLDKLGLKTSQTSTQIVPPEPVTRLFDEIVTVAGAISNLAHDMRHLQRTEISEVREKFDPKQTGSSTMAHKRNPISFENVNSLFKQVLAQNINYRQNHVSEHQRDLTDSASSRFYPMLVALVTEMAHRLDGSMQKLEVDSESLQRNLHMLGGAIGAEPLYLLLNKYGHPDGHALAKKIAQDAIDSGTTFYDAVTADAEIMGQYWPQFSDQEKKIVTYPEQHYVGIAADKARAIADDWR